MQSSTDAPKLDHDDYVWAATRQLTMVLGGGPSARQITVWYEYRDIVRGLAIPTLDQTCSSKDDIESALKRAIDELRMQEVLEQHAVNDEKH